MTVSRFRLGRPPMGAALLPGAGIVALLVLAGCGSPGDSPTLTPSAVETPADVAEPLDPPWPRPHSPARPSPTADEAQPGATSTPAAPAPGPDQAKPYDPAVDGTLIDVNGTWCPTSPVTDGVSCVVIDLPTVHVVGDDDPSHISYVYPLGPKAWEDPREFTDEDYLFGPEDGDCWNAAVDGYPGSSGAVFMFCPAGGESGADWIDNPVDFTFSVASGTVISDYTGQDRVYMTQELTPYPYVRSDG